MRLIEFSVMGNHLHLIVESDDSRAMQGRNIRIAKALNRMMGPKGRVFADRFHSSLLTKSDAARECDRVRSWQRREAFVQQR
jgi:REP element-mobilizing transposase RayT